MKKNDLPQCSGHVCVRNSDDLGDPIVQSIESLEPLCDEIIISLCLPEMLSPDQRSQLEELKQTYQHPKFKFISYQQKPSLGRALNAKMQMAAAKKTCSSKNTYGLYASQMIPKERLQELHDLSILRNQNLRQKAWKLRVKSFLRPRQKSYHRLST